MGWRLIFGLLFLGVGCSFVSAPSPSQGDTSSNLPFIQPTTRAVRTLVASGEPGCPIIPFATGRPPDANTAAFTDTWYSNAEGTLWAGLAPDYLGKWYAGQRQKVLWYTQGQLQLQGKGLDGSAPPLDADIPSAMVEGVRPAAFAFPSQAAGRFWRRQSKTHYASLFTLILNREP